MDQALGSAVFAGMTGVTFFLNVSYPGVFLYDYEDFLPGRPRRNSKAQ